MTGALCDDVKGRSRTKERVPMSIQKEELGLWLDAQRWDWTHIPVTVAWGCIGWIRRMEMACCSLVGIES